MANPVFNIGGDLVGNLLSGSFILIGVLILIAAIVGVTLYVRYIRQFNITVEIKSRRAGGKVGQENYKLVYDKAAIIKDRKDNHYYFRLKNERIDMPVPPFEVLQITTSGNTLKLLQKSNDEYIFLLPDTIDMSVVVMSDGSQVPVGQLTLKQVEGDVSYWNVIRKRSNRKMFDSESMIMKVLPFVGLLILFVGFIFITWMILKKFDVLSGVAASLERTASILKGVGYAPPA